MKADELQREKCTEIIEKVPDLFLLAEPSVVYQEVCGTLARRLELTSWMPFYLKTAMDNDAVLVSLDKEDFVDKVRAKKPPVEVYHVSEFPC